MQHQSHLMLCGCRRHLCKSAAHRAMPAGHSCAVTTCLWMAPVQELYVVSRQLAIAVIPNEYGIDPQGKLRIGSRIATEVGNVGNGSVCPGA
eukprot:scaffold44882_cov18-Tisochrysis_lutea.AAC.1